MKSGLQDPFLPILAECAREQGVQVAGQDAGQDATEVAGQAEVPNAMPSAGPERALEPHPEPPSVPDHGISKPPAHAAVRIPDGPAVRAPTPCTDERSELKREELLAHPEKHCA